MGQNLASHTYKKHARTFKMQSLTFTSRTALAGSTRMASTSSQTKKVVRGRGQLSVTNMAAKDLYFNAQDGLALKKMQKGVDKLSHVVGGDDYGRYEDCHGGDEPGPIDERYGKDCREVD